MSREDMGDTFLPALVPLGAPAAPAAQPDTDPRAGGCGQPPQPRGCGRPPPQPRGCGRPPPRPTGCGRPPPQPRGCGRPPPQPRGCGRPPPQPRAAAATAKKLQAAAAAAERRPAQRSAAAKAAAARARGRRRCWPPGPVGHRQPRARGRRRPPCDRDPDQRQLRARVRGSYTLEVVAQPMGGDSRARPTTTGAFNVASVGLHARGSAQETPLLPPRQVEEPAASSPLRPALPEAEPKAAGVEMAGTFREHGHQREKASTAHGPGARSRSRSPRRHTTKAGEDGEDTAEGDTFEGILPPPWCDWRGCRECRRVAVAWWGYTLGRQVSFAAAEVRLAEVRPRGGGA